MADFRSRFPQGRPARRGRPARHPPCRRPSELASLGPIDPSATGARPFVLRSFRPVVDRPRMGEIFPGARPIDKRTSGPQDNSLPPLVPSASGVRPFVLLSFRPAVVWPRRECFPPRSARSDSSRKVHSGRAAVPGGLTSSIFGLLEKPPNNQQQINQTKEQSWIRTICRTRYK